MKMRGISIAVLFAIAVGTSSFLATRSTESTSPPGLSATLCQDPESFDGGDARMLKLKLYGNGIRTGACDVIRVATFEARWGLLAPNGRSLALVRNDRNIEVLDLPTMEVRATLSDEHRGLFPRAFSPSGRLLVMSREDRTVIWDVGTAQPSELSRTAWAACGARFDGEGALLFSNNLEPDEPLRWDFRAGESPQRIAGMECGPRGSWSRISPDGRWWLRAKSVATGGQRVLYVEIWDIPARTLRWGHPTGIGGVYDVSFSADGTRLAVVGAATSPDRYLEFGRIHVWSLEDGQEIMDVDEPWPVLSCCFTPDGRLISKSCVWETMSDQHDPEGLCSPAKIWDLEHPRQFRTLRALGSQSVLLEASEDDLVLTSEDPSAMGESRTELVHAYRLLR